MPVTRPGIWASPLMYRLELFSMKPASKNGQNVHLTSMSIHTFIPDLDVLGETVGNCSMESK